jgi:intracellular multiplication protein IcmL
MAEKMAEEELHTVELQDGFYRDSFSKMILVIAAICTAIILLIGLSLYFFLAKPKPITFLVDREWRVQPAISLAQPYLATANLLQWVSDVLPLAFNYDFNHYNDQLKLVSKYFTADGWKIFLNQLNIYANYNNVQSYKLFVNGTPAGAPYILNQGLLSGRYGWWVQMQVTINYAGLNPPPSKTLTLQVLVVRVSTLNNLMGVGIDNVVVTSGAMNQQIGMDKVNG